MSACCPTVPLPLYCWAGCLALNININIDHIPLFIYMSGCCPTVPLPPSHWQLHCCALYIVHCTPLLGRMSRIKEGGSTPAPSRALATRNWVGSCISNQKLG